MKRIVALFLALLTVGCATSNVPSDFMSASSPTSPAHRVGSSVPWGGDLAGSGNAAQYVASISGNAGAGGDVAFTSTGLKATASPFNIKDSGGVTRDTFETAHGRFQAGGGGSDFKAAIGPMVSFETSNAAMYLLPNATAASGTNPVAYSDGTGLWLNSPNASGTINFVSAGATVLGAFNWSQSRFFAGGNTGAAPFIVDWATAGQAQFISGTGATTGLLFGTTASGGLVDLVAGAGARLHEFAAGTQSGVALGANLATVGHQRTPNGFVWMGRNTGNTGNINIIKLDTADQLTIGDATLVNSVVVRGGGNGYLSSSVNTNQILASLDNQLDQTTLRIRNNAATEYITVTPAATALIQFNVTNATSGQIGWTGSASAAGNQLSIIGNTAGGTNDGGQVVVNGGSHAGSGTVDGSFKLVNAPFNGGLVAFTPVNGANNLNNAQSDANFMLLSAGATGGFTVTFQRRIADTSCVWIRNNTSQLATISFLTGGTATIATSTSGLICSDGTNLQKLMAGT